MKQTIKEWWELALLTALVGMVVTDLNGKLSPADKDKPANDTVPVHRANVASTPVRADTIAWAQVADTLRQRVR